MTATVYGDRKTVNTVDGGEPYTIVDVAQQLPPKSYMVMLYSPIDSQKNLIQNAINQMIVDRSIQEVEQNGMPHSRS